MLARSEAAVRSIERSRPPVRGAASKTRTVCPRRAAISAALSPAGPAPTTTTSFGVSAGVTASSYSRNASGLCTQLISEYPASLRLLHTSAPTHGRTRWASPRVSLATISGSAMCARVIATMSHAPVWIRLSAMPTDAMRPTPINGSGRPIASLSCCAFGMFTASRCR